MNPYLAHMYENTYQHNGGSSNSYGSSSNASSLLSGFNRHATTAKQAHEAEDGLLNPFTGGELSQKYFNILKGRRDLPVHMQR